jgi:hypothetical protein
MRRIAVWIMAAALAACSPSPQPAHPALWQVDGPHGERAWLFGTIHALERPVAWHSAPIDAALAQSDRIVVEIADMGHSMSDTFEAMSHSPGLPPLSQRVAPEYRESLERLLASARMPESRFAQTETWAAALTLSRAGEANLDSANGIDRAVVRAAGGKPVGELEGARGQLSLFDSLPERDQRDLLQIVVADADKPGSDSTGLAEAWRKGDMAAIEVETHRGLLADPELREVLFAGRNRAWSDRIAAMMQAGAHPFVAAGAAHMAGAEGLPALLAAKGYRVTRVQ